MPTAVFLDHRREAARNIQLPVEIGAEVALDGFVGHAQHVAEIEHARVADNHGHVLGLGREIGNLFGIRNIRDQRHDAGIASESRDDAGTPANRVNLLGAARQSFRDQDLANAARRAGHQNNTVVDIHVQLLCSLCRPTLFRQILQINIEI
jgi:hypothetical protein